MSIYRWLSYVVLGWNLIGSPQAQEGVAAIDELQAIVENQDPPLQSGLNLKNPDLGEEIDEEHKTAADRMDMAKATLAAQESMAQSTESLVQLAQRQYTLASDSNKLLFRTLLATTIAAIAAVVAAFAAWIAVRDARRTDQGSLRAYLGVSVEFEPLPEGNTKREYKLVFTNHGQTPALQVRHWSHHTIGPEVMREHFLRGPDVWHELPAINPQSNASAVKNDVGLSAHALHDNANLIIYGVVEYLDVFNKKSIVSFCLQSGDAEALKKNRLYVNSEGNSAHYGLSKNALNHTQFIQGLGLKGT